MAGLIVVHGEFDAHWPFVADHFLEVWRAQDETELVRLDRSASRELEDNLGEAGDVTRLVCLGVEVTVESLRRFPALREASFQTPYGEAELSAACRDFLIGRGVILHQHQSEGFWGQSVAEFALALTICGLRRIPQLYLEMQSSYDPWLRYRPVANRGPQTVGAQYCDDSRFVSGTIAGKRVRVVGAGNIGSRYASFVKMLGADVATWDPFAPDPNFHRSGSRKEWHLQRLVEDAQVFAPMLPLTDQTRGLIGRALIDALPKGCLVVLATRANICDVEALRHRVAADEISLAADVFDEEPLAHDDVLCGRHNVVHTPHIAGRTEDANRQWVNELAAQFEPVADRT